MAEAEVAGAERAAQRRRRGPRRGLLGGRGGQVAEVLDHAADLVEGLQVAGQRAHGHERGRGERRQPDDAARPAAGERNRGQQQDEWAGDAHGAADRLGQRAGPGRPQQRGEALLVEALPARPHDVLRPGRLHPAQPGHDAVEPALDAHLGQQLLPAQAPSAQGEPGEDRELRSAQRERERPQRGAGDEQDDHIAQRHQGVQHRADEPRGQGVPDRVGRAEARRDLAGPAALDEGERRAQQAVDEAAGELAADMLLHRGRGDAADQRQRPDRQREQRDPRVRAPAGERRPRGDAVDQPGRGQRHGEAGEHQHGRGQRERGHGGPAHTQAGRQDGPPRPAAPAPPRGPDRRRRTSARRR